MSNSTNQEPQAECPACKHGQATCGYHSRNSPQAPEGDAALAALGHAPKVSDRCTAIVKPLPPEKRPPGPKNPPIFCHLKAGHGGPHRFNYGGMSPSTPFRASDEVEFREPITLCAKCGTTWPCPDAQKVRAALASPQAAPEGTWRDGETVPDCPRIENDQQVYVRWYDNQGRRCSTWMTAQEIGDLRMAESERRAALIATPQRAPEGDTDRIYPCADCGVLRTKAEGGTTFTVCDACWDKRYGKTKPASPQVQGGEDDDPLEGHGGECIGWWKAGDFLFANPDDDVSELMDKGWQPVALIPPSMAFSMPNAAALASGPRDGVTDPGPLLVLPHPLNPHERVEREKEYARGWNDCRKAAGFDGETLRAALASGRPSDAAIAREFWKRWTSTALHIEAAHELQRIHDDAAAPAAQDQGEGNG